LIAQSTDSSRVATYRIANISAFETIRKSFKRPKHFDLPQYWRESLARFEADLACAQAHIALTPRGEIWMQNLRMKAVPVSEVKPTPGWREYLLSIESIEHGARHVLSFGAEARVLGPPELRQRVIDEAGGVLASYRRA
jgi:predicted DNA-binding transcriptional regulator YafY